MEVKKVIRDGKVAVLVSPGFGAGWSTWAHLPLSEVCLFDPIVVEWVEGGKNGEVPVSHYGDEYFYTGGSEGLEIEWLPVGTHFEIHEYDGSESLRVRDDMMWNVA
jgi:hypothetical protein